MNGGGSGNGQPTLIRNNDGYIKISGSGTHNVQVNLDRTELQVDLGIEELKAEFDEHLSDSSVHITDEKKAEWDLKQEKLNAGENNIISGNIISAADSQKVTTHMNNEESHVTAADKAACNGKQEVLTAGDYIIIVDDTISANLSSKQDQLVSGSINGQRLLGSRNLTIGGRGSEYLDKSETVTFESTTYFSTQDKNIIKQGRTVFFYVNLVSQQAFSFSRNARFKISEISNPELFPVVRMAVNIVTENLSTVIYANTAVIIETNGEIMLVNTSDVSTGPTYNFRVGNTHFISMTYVTA
ncbi:hypothetical protein [Enterococcus sp. CWB-B31]|uniref:hypothetical protein n=1 Tax=Enterococcus sp. CWB-B31 TaxID=2885159 RepID=UPI001E28F72A|nr:hypothetical protein [Enterococcus sp. CWB-B31]MCB5954004.1 hypothetical protein [Enterococcus sp. CWB-B31]